MTAVVLVLTGLLGGCGTAPAGQGGPLDGLHACPDGAGDIIGVFLRLGGPTEDEPDRSDLALDTWALTSTGEIQAITTDGVHGQPLISPDARYVYTTRGSGLEFGGGPELATGLERWDLRTSEVTPVRNFSAILGVSLSADGRRLAVTEPPTDPAAGIPQYPVTIFSPDGDGEDVVVGIAATNSERTMNNLVSAPEISPDGQQLAYTAFTFSNGDLSTSESSIHVRDIATGEDTVLDRFDGSAGSVPTVVWSSDGRTLIATMNHIPEPGTLETPQVLEVLRFDLTTGERFLDDAFGYDPEPIRLDGSVLLALSEDPREEGAPLISLVAWDQTSRTSTVLPMENSLSLLSIASCSYW